MTDQLARLDDEVTADEHRSLTVRSRGAVYVVAGVLFGVALLLAALRVGERAGRLSDWQALVLGMTQGFSELLPISSSGHLILVPWVADWRYLEHHADFNKTFDVALHLGTLISVVVYFWADLVIYVKAFFAAVGARAIRTDDERIAVGIAIATIPAAIAGALGESAIESRLGQPWQIAILLAVFGALLWIADQTPQRASLRDLGLGRAILIGISQILALMPGISRSGITITTGRFSGLTAMPRLASPSCCSSRSCSVQSSTRAPRWPSTRCRPARPGRSSSERSPRQRSAWSPSTSCSATSGITATPRSRSTGSSSRSSSPSRF